MVSVEEKGKSAPELQPPLEQSGGRVSELTSQIKSLYDEYMQVSELSEMEKASIAEATSLLKVQLALLNLSFRIQSSTVLKEGSSRVADAIVTSEGRLVLVERDGMVRSQPLEKLSAESLLMVLGEIVPQIKTHLQNRREQIGMSLGMLDKANRELRRISSVSFVSNGGPELGSHSTVSEKDHPAKSN